MTIEELSLILPYEIKTSGIVTTAGTLTIRAYDKFWEVAYEEDCGWDGTCVVEDLFICERVLSNAINLMRERIEQYALDGKLSEVKFYEEDEDTTKNI